MKKFLIIILVGLFAGAAVAQTGIQADSTVKQKDIPSMKIENQIIEAACGQCQFGLPGESCDLAVRIDGKAYFVDGTGIDDHGDAHAADGFCAAIRQAKVSGEVLNGRFEVVAFELLPDSLKQR